MPAPSIDRKLVEQLLQRAAATLTGRWVLIGGALAQIWLDSPRSTRDIDLFSERGSLEDRLALMELATALGLPIEAVNPAADFFVRRVPGWQDMLEPLLTGGAATIVHPNPTFFVMLKMGRLSESDLDDCLLLLRHVSQRGWLFDANRIRQEVAKLPPTENQDLLARRQKLVQSLPG